MGAVACHKHGTQGGPHCCRHLLEAIYHTSAVVNYRMVKTDLGGYGDFLQTHLICEPCMEQYRLHEGDIVKWLTEEDAKRFPWTCPVCGVCLREYEDSRKSAADEGATAKS